jgi:endonuclease/exonuclease/phosphatase family metal-dependent hydrolase
MEKLRIMTFNTQHCASFESGKIDFELMAKVIKDGACDIVGLNEMRGDGPDPEYTPQTEELSRLSGLGNFFFAPAIELREGLYGNGLLSRYPIVDTEIIPIPDPSPRGYDGYYESRCILKARLENGLTLLITHFGLNPDEQESAVNTLLPHLSSERCVLMGDFNLTPDSDILLPIREKMKDSAELIEGDALTFPSDRPQIKIDYVFTSRDIEILSADIPKAVASDHRPHLAEIALK